MGLPDKVVAENGDEDVPLYILKQTHEPLLRKDDGQNYSSKVLSYWSRSADSARYTFCPDKAARFDESHPFSADSLRTHLASVTPKYAPDFQVRQAGACVEVVFGKSRKGYMDFLTRYEYAPTLKRTDRIELGLGEFFTEDIAGDKISLRRKKLCRNGYNKIVVYEAAVDPAVDFRRKDVADFNRISWREVPPEVSRRFISFENIPLKSGVLVLTSPDSELRSVIYNCLDVPRFRQAAFPNKSKFKDIETILPVGVPGGRAGKPEQVCDSRARRSGRKTAVLATLIRNNGGQLEKLSKDFYRATGVRIKIKYYSAQDLVKLLFTRPHPYDMVAISFSVVQPEYETFFKDFVVKDRFIDFDVPQVASLLELLRKSEDEHEKTAIAVKIADELGRRSVVLPLYQEVRTFYYPAEIKNMMVGRGFTEYPEVADFRW